MDKLNLTFQATPVTTEPIPSVSSWYSSEITSGRFTPSEATWMHAQGWTTIASVTSGGSTTYFMTRRILKPEQILSELVSSYTTAYNEGRQLNDQRYDDLLTLYLSVLDKTEDTYNLLEADDDTFETQVEVIIAAFESEHAAYAADVDGDLDTWGTDLLAEINARFDAELSKALNALTDRGLASATMWVTESAGVERERTRALNNANDLIAQRQLELKHKINDELIAMRGRVLATRDRLRTFLHGAKDRQVEARNLTAAAVARLVEARTDSYPDLGDIGRLAASLGAGSPEAYSP